MQLHMETSLGKKDTEVGVARVKNSRLGRWFTRKAYGIGIFDLVITQLLATGAISTYMILHPSLARSIVSIPYNEFGFLVAGIGCLKLLRVYQHKHPHNLIWLAAFTLIQSLIAGAICSFTDASIVLQALCLTTAAVITLTACGFWAFKRGNDFSFLGPNLFLMLMFFVATGVTLVFFPTVFADITLDFYALGGIIFSFCIVHHTEQLLKRRLGSDQNTSDLVVLYLDMVCFYLVTLRSLHELSKSRVHG